MALSCSKNLSALWHKITSKNKGDFYCLNCLHSFRTENKLKSDEKVCKNRDFCGVVMPLEKDYMLEFNQYMKSDRMFIYADIKPLIKKIDGCVNNPESSSTTKIGEHIPCRYSTIWAFDNIEKKHSFYRGEDYTKMFCTSLREHATNVINLENYCYRWQKKNWNHIKTQKYIIFAEKESWKSLLMIKIIEKWGAIVILQVIIEAQYIVFVS